MTLLNNNIAASAMKRLRVEAMLREVPKTQIAQITGLHRQTVAKYMRSPNAPLDAFIAISAAIGTNPAQIIDDAVRSTSQGENHE